MHRKKKERGRKRPYAYAPAGGARVDRRPHTLENLNIVFLSRGGGPFCYFFLLMYGLFRHMALSCLYRGLFLGLPPPTKISAGAHDHMANKNNSEMMLEMHDIWIVQLETVQLYLLCK